VFLTRYHGLVARLFLSTVQVKLTILVWVN